VTQRRFEQLVRELTDLQKAAVTNLALDLRRPWMLRQLRQRPLISEDDDERRALLTGLNAIGLS
jgi:hypothetical protein